jgi:phosphoglycolate phosphatase-like HAD superfamily hydrolase
MIALFWDLDGTLLTTERAGVFSLEDALEQVTGVRADLQAMATAGMTDYAIAETALREAGAAADEGTVREFLRVHGAQLERYLGRRQGRVMPNVREILAAFHDRDDVRSYLLTGNIEAGARAKLEHYGLLEFFDGGGAFCVGPGDRVEIAQRALPLADGAEAVWVIGDTPADVACGAAIGASTLAVATGSYDVEALRGTGATTVVAELPPPERFAELVGAAAPRQ